MIKLTIIISSLAVGGAEKMLLKLLQRLDATRYQVSVISLTDEGVIGPQITALGIQVYTFNMRRGTVPNPIILFHLARLLKKLGSDIVHTWMYHSDLIGGIAARLAGNSNVVWSLRHSDLSKANNKLSTLTVVKLCSLLSSQIPKRIISCSAKAKDIHVAVGYCEHKLHVIPNGFELDRFVPDSTARTSVRKELGLPTKVPLVGLIARFHSQKNQIGFIEAAERVALQHPDVHFILAGKDVDYENTILKSLIHKKGLQKNIHLMGSRDDIPRLMAALDVLASTSHGEAFPNVLGEAMACGVPCVVTDVGDSADIVGNTGRVVEAGDMAGMAIELLSILQMSEAEKLALGQKARARVVANYDINHVVDLYQDFYDQIMIKNIKRCF